MSLAEEELKMSQMISKGIRVFYSDDKVIAILEIQLPDSARARAFVNVISDMVSRGYEYKGAFHTDISKTTESHFITYLLFQHISKRREELT